MRLPDDPQGGKTATGIAWLGFGSQFAGGASRMLIERQLPDSRPNRAASRILLEAKGNHARQLRLLWRRGLLRRLADGKLLADFEALRAGPQSFVLRTQRSHVLSQPTE